MTTPRYAAATTVSVEKSRMEIEQTLKRYKADAFAYATEGRAASIMFAIAGRRVRFRLMMPDPKRRDFTHHARGVRTESAAEAMWEQACRQSWRALALVIKAKLEAVAAGITTVEDEFLAHTVLPSGKTVGEEIQPQITLTYQNGNMPPLLGGPSNG